jgi:hypothetical protein
MDTPDVKEEIGTYDERYDEELSPLANYLANYSLVTGCFVSTTAPMDVKLEAPPEPEASFGVGEVCPINATASERSASEPDEDCFL